MTNQNATTEFEKLLNRSSELYKIIFEEIYIVQQFDNSFRSDLSKILGGISLEHASSLNFLMRIGNFTTASAILRLQFEALTRSMWLLFAAYDSFLNEYKAPVDKEHLPNDFPSVQDMIKQIINGSVPDSGLMLQRLKNVAWSGMNSFVHSAFHAIHRFNHGYPSQLLNQQIHCSNAMLIMQGMVLANITGNAEIVSIAKNLQIKFQDCCPALERQ